MENDISYIYASTGKSEEDLDEELRALYVLFMHLREKYGENMAAYLRLTETIRSRFEGK